MSTTSKLQTRLREDVVIFENKEAQKTGAQSIAPHGWSQALQWGTSHAKAATIPWRK